MLEISQILKFDRSTPRGCIVGVLYCGCIVGTRNCLLMSLRTEH